MQIPDWLAKLPGDALVSQRMLRIATGLTRQGLSHATERGRLPAYHAIREEDGQRVWLAADVRAFVAEYERTMTTGVRVVAVNSDGRRLPFRSMSAAARAVGCSKQMVHKCMRYKGWRFEIHDGGP